MNLISKAKTLWRYTHAAWALGDDLRSRLVLATLLPRLKLPVIGVDGERLHKVRIKVDSLRRVLYLRTQDIFLVYEVLWGNPYVHPEMLQILPRCILDLGAHIGLATLRFKASFPQAIIHCYEPDPENFQLLELNTEGLNGVVLHKEAVGVVSGEGILYVQPERHASSSLVPPRDEKGVKKVGCKVRTLDEILQELGQVDLVKFDIEGIENEVFRVSRLIQQVPFIVGEIKTDKQGLKQLLALFLRHEAHVQSITSKMHLVYLRRRDLS